MSGFHCATCGEYHNELPMCLGAPAPPLWNSLSETERGENSGLSSDQCVIRGEHFFVLGRLLLPVIDGPDSFVWLVWVSLSEASFRRVNELWEQEGRESEPPYFGWLQSALPYQPTTLSLKTSVQTSPAGERPVVTLEASDHPLFIEQRDGITMARVQEIVEAALHG
ncbi:DUF2199 domain-containing protein [Roseateles sp. DC23W]|uniref:DUF2199 domain-containing protein n=1 Tax=Pelomonas dachongensis TaxID=3299029 RepID=A0ABW7EMF0_9BURK